MKDKKQELKNTITKHKIQLILIVLAFALTIEIASISYIVYIKKHEKKLLTVYETTTQLLTIYNTEAQEETETIPEVVEEKPIVIKKAPINDKEDTEKQYTDNSLVQAKETTIEEAKSLYETQGNSIGIDVSKWNGNIDWKTVANSGVEFAIIRCGYRGYGSGEILMDPYFEQNISGAIKNGIKVGIYFYSAAINEAEAIEEARYTVELIKKYKITYPVVYDFENFLEGRCANLGKTANTTNALAFLNYVKSKGYTPMMYASKNAYLNYFEVSRFGNMKFWLAHYTDKTDYNGSYQMWQHTSKGSVPGIKGNVDMNIAYFKYSADAPAKEPEEEKQNNPTQNKPATEEKTVLTFKDANDKVITINETDYFIDYNYSEKTGVIPANFTLDRLSISEDGNWSKVKYADQEVYVKSSCLQLSNEIQNKTVDN